MNWKQFKTWLEENMVEGEELKIKIKLEKQGEYGELSTIALTNFCDSLEATLDNDVGYHLFPEFSGSKNFAELFEYQNCYFGKKTNQEKINEVDYKLLGKLFSDWKNEQQKDKAITTDNNDNVKENVIENNPTSEVRNILLIGTTGSGKSTLANVLMGENRFRESSRSISITKNVEEGTFEVEIDKEGKEKIKYRVIDTIGIGDTKMKPQGVLMRLAEMADRVKQEGLNQILFVIKSRFTKEEIEAYDLLSSIIFDKEVINYTTIVRTGFEEFEDKEACDDDRGLLRTENAELAQLRAVDIIYLDNPPLKGRNAEANREIREESRKRILTYLGGCRKTYRPKNIDTLDERVQDYKTNEEKLKEKMKELEKARKEQETEFRKKLTELKEDQVRELRENRKKFEEDLNKVKTEGEENLRKTVNEMEEKRRKDLEEHDRKNEEKRKESEAKYEKDKKELKEENEKREKAFQEETQMRRTEMENLRSKLDEAGKSTIEFMQKQRADDLAREEKREKERQAAEEKRQELERKKARMKAEWDKWEEDKKIFFIEQNRKFWGWDSNWKDKMPKPPSGNLDNY